MWNGSLDSWFHWNNLLPCGLALFWPHLSHVEHPKQLFLWCLYFLHLKYHKGMGRECSNFPRQYQIFSSLGIMNLFTVKMYV